jgi:hydroxymethylglutaryl-CoA reductase
MKELITEASVENLLKDISKEDRSSLSVYTHMMMLAFANKGNVKVAIIFDTDDSLGIGVINMTTAEVMTALEETRENLYEVITQDMPPKEMLN